MRQWESFANTFLYFFSPQGLTAYVLGLIAIKVLHEMGHAYTAVRYGCQVQTMGIGFLIMVPVLVYRHDRFLEADLTEEARGYCGGRHRRGIKYCDDRHLFVALVSGRGVEKRVVRLGDDELDHGSVH